MPTLKKTICNTCPAGKFANISGASFCFPCSAGKYLSKENSFSDGIDCPVGTFSESFGTTHYTNCIVGKSHNQKGATSSANCVLCAKGKYFALTLNATQCDLCPVGRYANLVGLTAVSDCLDCSLQALLSSLTEGSNCTTVGQIVPFVQTGFYRNNASDPFNILKCIRFSACLSSENGTLYTDGYERKGCGSSMSSFYRSGVLKTICLLSLLDFSVLWTWLILT